MKMNDVFLRLGFGKNAVLVYQALLDQRELRLITHIAHACGIDRPEVYRNMKELIRRKFVKKIQVGKRSYYSAESMTRVQDEFEDAGRDVGAITEKIIKKREKELPGNIEYLYGPYGITQVFDDAINRTPRGGTFYRYTSERDLDKVNQCLSPDYRKNRDKKKLERLVISNPVSGRAKRARLERFIKFIPCDIDTFDQNVIQLVYADSLAFINLNTEKAFIIRDQDLARFQAVIFNQLYKKL